MKIHTGWTIICMRTGLPVMILLFLLLPACATINDEKRRDHWFAHDKAQHFAVSAVIGAATAARSKSNGGSRCDAASKGISVSLAVGAGKEFYDKYIRKKYWSWKDLFWDLAGGALGSHAVSACH